MKIVIATPLYPPDIGEAAIYTKEVARRLAENHDVTVVAYGQLPESADNVNIIPVSKKQPLFIRLAHFTMTLWRETRKADVIYAQNGASVELPVALVAFFTRTPLVLHIADKAADIRANKSMPLHIIQRIAFARAHNVIRDMPVSRPEILPFEPIPTEALTNYDASWQKHLNMLETAFKYGK